MNQGFNASDVLAGRQTDSVAISEGAPIMSKQSWALLDLGMFACAVKDACTFPLQLCATPNVPSLHDTPAPELCVQVTLTCLYHRPTLTHSAMCFFKHHMPVSHADISCLVK